MLALIIALHCSAGWLDQMRYLKPHTVFTFDLLAISRRITRGSKQISAKTTGDTLGGLERKFPATTENIEIT